MADIEIWKDIEGFENLYQVSDQGNVRSCDRYLDYKRGTQHFKVFKKGQPIKKQLDSHGYEQVQLHYGDRKKVKSVLVHKLVAKAFIPNPDNKPCVDHISTLKTDNSVSNLRWVSYKENANNPISIEHNKKGHENCVPWNKGIKWHKKTHPRGWEKESDMRGFLFLIIFRHE